ncbi:SCAN domain-containing protein 3-like [Daktulosphaira vitifoliae]|uniref:SCAN domain-containing protein 3-like n=1 Tax=Daktulosphaira vitifoliae TaxID=58002 RepID=UPI0021AA5E01|nr:SCAN domain-containing protein 3-like [Daktulosphaira vitifoliae]
MWLNIKNKLLLYLKNCNFFALQIDESTDIANMAQLMVFIRFDRNDEIIEEFLFYLPWGKCVGFCSDGARAITGRLTGVATRIKKVVSLCKTMHCMTHRQALASNNMSRSLKLVLDSAVKIVNLIKARPLNSRLFTVLCNEMNITHKSLLLHTEVRSEVLLLLTDIDKEKSKFFCDNE